MSSQNNLAFIERSAPMTRSPFCHSLTLSLLLISSMAFADTVDDAIFAYDYENISGTTVTALRGTDGTIDGTFAPNTSNNLSFSSQHLRAPTDNSFGGVNSNETLTGPINALSFSTMYHANGDNGGEGAQNLVRFLSTYVGAGAVNADDIAFSMLGTGSTRSLVLNIGGVAATSDPLAFVNTDWQQVGFRVTTDGVNATVTFFNNGAVLGTNKVIAVPQIVTQGSSWHLFEDTTAGTTSDEYFDGGDYDESALWYRALSDTEFADITSEGLAANAIPEPATGMLCTVVVGSLVFFRRRRK